MAGGSTFRCTIFAAALAVGSPLPTVAADDTSQFRGNGIYRPFNWIRQVRLTTAYFLEPWAEADFAYAHRLSDALRVRTVKDVALALGTGEMRLAVPVDESSGYLTPISSPCQLQAGSPRSSEAQECVDWLNALREEHPARLREVHVFVEEELNVTGSGRMVTWDPDEVVEGRCNLPLSWKGYSSTAPVPWQSDDQR